MLPAIPPAAGSKAEEPLARSARGSTTTPLRVALRRKFLLYGHPSAAIGIELLNGRGSFAREGLGRARGSRGELTELDKLFPSVC
jgi:hypothetical protein